MSESKKKKKWSARPLLVATAGVALIGMGACGGTTAGNLIAPVCDGGVDDTAKGCFVPSDGGTDGGTDGG